MDRKYDALEILPWVAEYQIHYRSTLPEVLHMEDTALLVMRDFERTIPLLTTPNKSAEEALSEMQTLDSHVMLVVEHDNLLGMVSSADILGPRTMRTIEERRIKHSEVKVRHVMTPADKLVVLDFKQVRGAKIGHLIATLKAARQSYALVVQGEPHHQTIRGLIYAHDIIRALDRAASVLLSEARSVLEAHQQY